MRSSFNSSFQAFYLYLAMNEVPWLGSVTGPGSITQWIKIAKRAFSLHSQSVAQSDSYKNTYKNHKSKAFKESREQQIRYNSPIKYWDGIVFLKDLRKKNKTLIIERIKREKNKMLVIERMKRFPGESSSMSSYWDHTQWLSSEQWESGWS